MAQTWNAVPLLATTDTLSDSRGYINDAFAALRSSFSGSSAPGSPVEGQPFYDTDTNVLSIYDGAAWVIQGDLDAGDYLGMLPLSAGSSYPLSGDLYCGSNKIINVADPTADQHAATRKYCTDTFLPLVGGTLTNDLTMGANDVIIDHDPGGANAATRKSYVDSQVLGGGTYTGDIAMDGNEVTGLPAAPSATGASSKEYTDGKFHTSTGHFHDGSSARRNQADDLLTDAGSFSAGNLLSVASGGVGFDIATSGMSEGNVLSVAADTGTIEAAVSADINTLVSGSSSTLTFVTSAQIDGTGSDAEFEIKTRSITFTNGRITSVGGESAWTRSMGNLGTYTHLVTT